MTSEQIASIIVNDGPTRDAIVGLIDGAQTKAHAEGKAEGFAAGVHASIRETKACLDEAVDTAGPHVPKSKLGRALGRTVSTLGFVIDRLHALVAVRPAEATASEPCEACDDARRIVVTDGEHEQFETPCPLCTADELPVAKDNSRAPSTCGRCGTLVHGKRHGCAPKPGREGDALDLDELELLHGAASSGRWAQMNVTDTFLHPTESWQHQFDYQRAPADQNDANGRASVALHNAAPELIRRARERDTLLVVHKAIIQAERERDALRIAITRAMGALVDAGTVIVPDEPKQIEDAIKALAAERDEMANQLEIARSERGDGGYHLDMAHRKLALVEAEREMARETVQRLVAERDELAEALRSVVAPDNWSPVQTARAALAKLGAT